MPELPDVEAYRAALEPRLVGRPLAGLRLRSHFLLRTFDPPVEELVGRSFVAVERIGKRLVLELEEERFAVLHLMIVGRLFWKEPPPYRLRGRATLAAFDLEGASLLVSESGSRKRAALHLVRGREGLAPFRLGGVDPLTCTRARLDRVLAGKRHTLKRALCDPRLFDGIGNAFSDEVLFEARLSPFQRTDHLDPAARERLAAALRTTLGRWRDELVAAARDEFPTRVRALRAGMAVHGRHGQPCPACGSPIQRIVYTTREASYCPRCQTDGRLLADRALSRLLHDDWPRTLEELEGP